MKEIKLKLHPCYCGGEMEIKKVAQNGGMDGTYWDWELTCNKCGLTKTYAADGFYGRPYKTFEEVVDDWNKKKEETIKTLEQESCEDVTKAFQLGLAFGFGEKYDEMDKVIEEVKKAVTSQQKIGHWIDDKCSVCGKGIEDLIDSREWYRNEEPEFCPFCGAKLIISQESEG